MGPISEKDRALLMLGRAQAMSAVQQIADVGLFKSIAEIKKTKGYKGLSAPGPDGKVRTVSTFEDFCTHLVGMSRQHVDRNIQLLEHLGDDGFEAAQEKQLGYREMLKISRLPNDLKDEAVQALIREDADRDSILEVVEDLAVRNSTLKTEVAIAAEDAADLQNKITNRDLEIETQKNRVKALEQSLLNRGQNDPYPEFVMTTRHEAGAMSDKALLCLDDLAKLDSALHDTARSANGDDVNVALISLCTHVNAVLVRSQRLAKDLKSRWGDAIDDATISGSMLYSDDEIDDMIETRNLLIRDHEQEKKFRANERENKKPRGRGRPKKQN